MSEQLQGKRVAFLVAAEGVEEVELMQPRDAVRDAGAEVDLIAPDGGEIQAFNHLDKGDSFDADRSLDESDALRVRRARPPRRGGQPRPAED